MADQKNRGGQKVGGQNPDQPEQHQGRTPDTAAGRADADKQRDQQTNPDDATRTPTDQQR